MPGSFSREGAQRSLPALQARDGGDGTASIRLIRIAPFPSRLPTAQQAVAAVAAAADGLAAAPDQLRMQMAAARVVAVAKARVISGPSATALFDLGLFL